MAIPAPEPGLVISYSYLWHFEHVKGHDEGRKNRPAVVVLAVEHDDGSVVVTVLAITHTPPHDLAAGVEIPLPVKKHLGLDDERSWVIVNEGNEFDWPGYDLRKRAGSEDYHYGFLPPSFFNRIADAFKAWHKRNKVVITSRD